MKHLIPIALLLLAGCSIVPTGTGWPKPVSYWSYEAREQRRAADQRNNYRRCLAELRQQLTLRRSQVIDLSAVGQKLAGQYGVQLVMNTILGEWQSGTTNLFSQTLACDVMWIQNQAPREQDLSWLLCFHSEWDGSK